MNIDLPPQYDPHAVEAPIYQKWLDAKAFHAVPDGRTNKFSMVIPPPNVTGALHLGHAINGTIQDVLTRYHRMKGDNTLWMPGIDHAGIATQAVVERTIFEKEKKSRHDLGREELVRRIWEWKEQFGTRILNQQAQLGASCDWDRTRFTLDEQCAKAVREAFFKMFKDGLIFRGKRLVNWDTHLQTAVADDEIYHETVKGQMTSIRYPVADDVENAECEMRNAKNADPSSFRIPHSAFIVVSTTRPETMLGDTAVAVHPDDPRYKHLHGKYVIVPLVGRRIPIITDGLLVDPAFGTGVVKVTPAHDPNDYATGERHNLEKINLLSPDGKVNENGQGEFLGKKYSYVGLKFATAARKQVLADLETLGLIAEIKVHEHEVGHSDRSKTPIEPYLSDQWFVRMGDIELTPPSEPRPSGSGLPAPPQKPLPDGRGSENPPHSSALAYFISFHTYATWVRGDEPGAVDDQHNVPGTPFIPPDPELRARELANASQPPFTLSIPQRQSILKTLREVADHRGWKLHAVNVRSTHLHAVVWGNHSPERMMNDFKSWATRRMREAGLISADAKVWSRHGSTPYLWTSNDVLEAVDYVLNRQGENHPDTFLPYNASSEPRVSDSQTFEPRPLGSGSIAQSEKPLPNGRGSEILQSGITLADGTHATGLAQAAMDAVTDGRVRITPDRYAKGYLDWLGQKRDWCISRQLWWGHRIPVWSGTTPVPGLEQIFKSSRTDTTPATPITFNGVKIVYVVRPDAHGVVHYYWCVPPGNSAMEKRLEAAGYAQDPDVLDTWFSSALWPLSTLGWPIADNPSEPRPSGSGLGGNDEKPLPDGRGSEIRGSDRSRPEPGLLEYFYPTSVLSTARDILTLWVARMVMFGLYCDGKVPFKDVYIHAVIQDGEGRTMSKSKGNGVDPVDIINSHGADALRFTLASMATETQDIRMPVVKDKATGANTSPKFDIGRNFANKIWNAARFILGGIDESIALRGNARLNVSHLEDRWILSRLNATIVAAESAINGYRFADLAESLRTFFWTDLCDWYLEIAKSRIKSGDQTVQQILLHALRTSLQLLHPLMPFITEELWSKLPKMKSEVGSQKSALLITAPWPAHDSSQIDGAAESQIALLQSLITAIREIQNRYPAAKGKPTLLQPKTPALQALIESSRGIIESLASTQIVENSPTAQKPENAATALLPGGECQIFIPNVIDKATEIVKLTKRKLELEKLIGGNRNKLSNEAFVQKAPPKIIQGLRDQLAKYEEELNAVEKNLVELG